MLAGMTRTVIIQYFDGSSREAEIVDEEVPFPDGKLIVSRTDKHGIITHCNQSFVSMSGYSEAELIGQAHYILRHPDMPRAAFTDLWDKLSSDGRWTGYVKNLRKDGRYYWVYASVIANVRDGELKGYTSVRRKPSRSKVNSCIDLYAQMLQQESP